MVHQKSNSDLSISTSKLYLFLLIIPALFIALSMNYFSHGEGREAVVVKSMLEQNNFILPLRNNLDIPSKPPAFHWIASFFHGTIQFPYPERLSRLPSVLASLILGLLWIKTIQKKVSITTVLYSVLFLISSFEWIRSSILARVDMVFTLGQLGCFLAIAPMLEKRAADFKNCVFLLFFIVLSVLSKGPAGLGIPLISLEIYALFFDRKLF